MVLLLIACYGLGSALAWRMAWRTSGSARAAWIGWTATTLSWPLLAESFTIYPDGVGGALVLVGVWTLLQAREGRLVSIAAGSIALAALPWLHTRMSLLAAALGIAIAARLVSRANRWNALAAFAAWPAISAATWFGFFKAIYGTWAPTAPYGEGYRTDFSRAFVGLPGLLFDQQYGLLTSAPVFIVGFAGIAAMLRGQRPGMRRLALELAALVVPYTIAVAAYPMWFGGAAAPARFVAAILPTAVIPIAASWECHRSPSHRAAIVALLLLSLTLSINAFGFGDGRFAIMEKAAFSPLWAWATRAADLPTALPSVLGGNLPLALVQSLVWVVAVAVWTILLDALGSTRGRRAAVAVPLTVAVVSAALGTSWAAARQNGLSVQPSRAALLHAAWPGGVGIALGNEARHAAAGQTIASLDSVVPLAVLEREGDGDAAPASGSASFGSLQAGRYRIEVESATPNAVARVRSGGDPALATLRVGGNMAEAHAAALEIDLPIPLNHLVVELAPPHAHSTFRVRALTVRDSVAPRAVSARQAARYGVVSGFFPSDRQFVEREGLWLRPGVVPMVLQSEGPGDLIRVSIRNTPVSNAIGVTAGSWRAEHSLSPHQETTIDIPLPSGRRAVYVEFRVANGVRPKDVDSSSSDMRRLGAWLAFPQN